jgi:hypothetical protein
VEQPRVHGAEKKEGDRTILKQKRARERYEEDERKRSGNLM